MIIKISSLFSLTLLFGDLLITAKASEMGKIIQLQSDLTQEEEDMLQKISAFYRLPDEVAKRIQDKKGSIEVEFKQLIKSLRGKVEKYIKEEADILRRYSEAKNATQNTFSVDIVEYNVKQILNLYDRISATRNDEA